MNLPPGAEQLDSVVKYITDKTSNTDRHVRQTLKRWFAHWSPIVQRILTGDIKIIHQSIDIDPESSLQWHASLLVEVLLYRNTLGDMEDMSEDLFKILLFHTQQFLTGLLLGETQDVW